MNHFAEELVNLFCCCCCCCGVQTDPMFFHGLVFCAATIHCSCYKVGEGTISATKQIEGFNLQREGENCCCSKIKSFNLQRKRERHPYCRRSRGSICGGRERQIFLLQQTKRFNLQSEGNNCCCSKIKWFNLQRERDRHSS